MPPPNTNKAATTSYIPENIQGSDKFKRNIRDICKKYTKVFNTKLARQPALVAPMKLHVNDGDRKVTKDNVVRKQTRSKRKYENKYFPWSN